jgi:hypothetical protein
MRERKREKKSFFKSIAADANKSIDRWKEKEEKET